MRKNSSRKSRGRPLEFDPDETLNRAIEIFWTQGYEGTSLADLTHALGINRPSIYAYFGNKEMLFRLAAQKYADTHLSFIDEAIKQTTLNEVFTMLLEEEVHLLTANEAPRGCMLVSAAISSSPKIAAIKALLINHRKSLETKLRKRIQKAQLSQDEKVNGSPATLAKAMCTIYEGISTEAASGASRRELLEIIPLAKQMLF